MRFYENDIAVVAYSGFFPEAVNEDQFFANLLKGRCLIQDLSEKKQDSTSHLEVFFSENKSENDKTYSKFGSIIPLKFFEEWARGNSLSLQESSAFEIAMHELFSRLQLQIPDLFSHGRSECVLAMATGDPYSIRVNDRIQQAKILDLCGLSEVEKASFWKDQSLFKLHPDRTKNLLKDRFTTLSYETVRERFKITGPCSFVDAACASSLAAVMLAVNRLRAGDSDLVITGGIDFGVTALTLSAFSRVRVLSESVMNPFDSKRDGMNQGEAAGVFALMPLKLAKDRGYPIRGVIRNCDGSSDGINGSVVEPTEYGQILAYERAYLNVPLHDLSYLECHGTGTILGDKTELASAKKYFHPMPMIGSVKANIGHTVGAAGAASLVKALKMIEQKIVPGLPKCQEPMSECVNLISNENQKLPANDVRVGVSSFGFGGANFHLVLDEYRDQSVLPPIEAPKSQFRLVVNGSQRFDLEYAVELTGSSRYRIPPVSLPYYDKAIVGAALATERLFEKLNLQLTPQQRENVGVISCSNGSLDKFQDCYDRFATLELSHWSKKTVLSREIEETIQKELSLTLPLTEDTFPGALNNLISGKITKNFDLKGVNFNLAGEKSGLGLAFSYVQSLLKGRTGAFLIINLEEDLSGQARIKRQFVEVFLVSDLEFSLKCNIPIEKEVTKVTMASARKNFNENRRIRPEL